jgi:hypothetical protein
MRRTNDAAAQANTLCRPQYALARSPRVPRGEIVASRVFRRSKSTLLIKTCHSALLHTPPSNAHKRCVGPLWACVGLCRQVSILHVRRFVSKPISRATAEIVSTDQPCFRSGPRQLLRLYQSTDLEAYKQRSGDDGGFVRHFRQDTREHDPLAPRQPLQKVRTAALLPLISVCRLVALDLGQSLIVLSKAGVCSEVLVVHKPEAPFAFRQCPRVPCLYAALWAS